jgi:hypothetical protein
MLLFGVTIPATVPQESEIPEGLMNNPVCLILSCIFLSALQVYLLFMAQVSWDILVYWLVNIYTTFWEEHNDFKPLIAMYQSAGHNIPENLNLHHYCSENLKCHFICCYSSVLRYLRPDYKGSRIFVNMFLSHTFVILSWICASEYTTVKPYTYTITVVNVAGIC